MDLDDREMLFSRDGLFCTIHFKMDHHEPAITQVTQVFSRRLPQCISLGVRGGADVMVGINSTQCMLPARALALLAPHDLSLHTAGSMLCLSKFMSCGGAGW